MTSGPIDPSKKSYVDDKGYTIWADKRLLNLPGHHSVAAISAHARYNDEHNYADGTVSISDCGRVISLDLSVNSERDLENALYKLDTLIETLSEMRSFIDVRGREWLSHSEERDRKIQERRANDNEVSVVDSLFDD